MTEAPSGCPVCGDDRRVPVVEQNRRQVVRCARCRQQYVWPVPSQTELAAIYDRSYYCGGHEALGFSDYDALAAARKRMFLGHLHRVEPYTRGRRVLDVGCATGDFLAVAQRQGWEAIGVDPSPAREQATAAGLPIVGHTLDDAEVSEQSLDLITFWDVLEHLPDPVRTLRRAASLLTPDGIVAATVPNAGSAVARISGRRWFGYKTAGEHLQFFTAATIRRSFEAAGFDVLVQRPVPWSCSVGFVLDRAALYLGPPGRLANTVLGSSGLSRLTVDVPQVNQFICGRLPTAPALAA
ncbi:MAG TPA: class I SAM-dependent methyltransferase [Candidatus Dormibacteraeota bacterium]|jgi:2-polyprenyl-3-methyl-5-hydroxy-6-metoxy-1,4-benzoquinol methylase|nr:class I SAM-dependent methyltransferase [Candidatus Dormibacteraeota bacterium]